MSDEKRTGFGTRIRRLLPKTRSVGDSRLEASVGDSRLEKLPAELFGTVVDNLIDGGKLVESNQFITNLRRASKAMNTAVDGTIGGKIYSGIVKLGALAKTIRSEAVPLGRLPEARTGDRTSNLNLGFRNYSVNWVPRSWFLGVEGRPEWGFNREGALTNSRISAASPTLHFATENEKSKFADEIFNIQDIAVKFGAAISAIQDISAYDQKIKSAFVGVIFDALEKPGLLNTLGKDKAIDVLANMHNDWTARHRVRFSELTAADPSIQSAFDFKKAILATKSIGSYTDKEKSFYIGTIVDRLAQFDGLSGAEQKSAAEAIVRVRGPLTREHEPTISNIESLQPHIKLLIESAAENAKMDRHIDGGAISYSHAVDKIAPMIADVKFYLNHTPSNVPLNDRLTDLEESAKYIELSRRELMDANRDRNRSISER